MRRRLARLVASLILLGWVSTVQAQPATALSTTTCPGAGCLITSVQGQGTVGLQITGTFVGTLTVTGSLTGVTYVTVNCTPYNSTTAVTTMTTTGAWSCVVAGLRQFRIAFTAYTSGTANVSTQTTQAKGGSGGGGGGGGTIGGTIAATQIAFGASADTLAGSASLTWDGEYFNLGDGSYGDTSLRGLAVYSGNALGGEYVSVDYSGTATISNVTALLDTAYYIDDAATFTNFRNVEAYLELFGAGTLTRWTSVMARIYNSPTGTVTQYDAFANDNDGVGNVVGGTFVSYNGVHLYAPTGPFTNARGLSIEDWSGVAATTLRPIDYAGKFVVDSSGNVVLGNGVALQPDTTTGHTMLFQVYDVNGTAMRTWMTATNGDAPDVTFAPPTTGTLVIQATTYKSSDGSTGATGAVCTSFKNGLCVAAM